MSHVPLYDDFAEGYDLMTDWPARLAAEAAFFQRLFAQYQVRSVLDTACGTGQHALAFARWGLQVTATDLSAAMIDWARNGGERTEDGEDATIANPQFAVVGFGEHAAKTPGPFDAVTCLGNSLPHVLESDALDAALADFRAVLKPGGLLILQNNNYDAILSQGRRFMGVSSREQGGKEYLFFRFFDLDNSTDLPGFRKPGRSVTSRRLQVSEITFHVVTFIKEAGNWTFQEKSTRQRPLLRADLEARLLRLGFRDLAIYGDCQGREFRAESAPNLVMVAV